MCRGKNYVISSPRFEIVVRGGGDVGNCWESGGVPVGGLFTFSEGCEQFGDRLSIHHRYSWGTLSYCINNASFSLRHHAREVVANGQSYQIQGRAIITIEEDGSITVEDESLDNANKLQRQAESPVGNGDGAGLVH